MNRSIFGAIALMSAALFTLSVAGCKEKKQDKTCAQEGESGATLGDPWKELDVASGEICISNEKHLKFITKNAKNPVDVSNKVSDQLKAKGWEPVEGSLIIRNSDDATVHIDRWEFKKGTQKINLKMTSYPANIWNDEPVRITLDLK